MKPLIISFSGGRTSALMAKLLVEKYRGEREIYTVFANTGRERAETLDFVRACDDAFGLSVVWLESVQYHGQRKSPGYTRVDYWTASRNGEPFEDVIRKHGIPNKPFPACTRELKTRPIEKWIKDTIGGREYEMALGIRVDEPARLKQKDGILYPLAYMWPTTVQQVRDFWNTQTFDLQLKDYEGNCDLCWKKSKRKLLTLIKEKPELTEWWQLMEKLYGHYVPDGQKERRIVPITFFRERDSIEDLIEESKFPFTPASDPNYQKELTEDMDHTDGCGESCEAF